MRQRLIGASLAIAALLSGAGAAEATPIDQFLPPLPGPGLVSAKILLSDSPRLFWELPLTAAIHKSVAQETDTPLPSRDLGVRFSEESPFHSPVSLTLGKTDVTIALETVGDPRELRRD